MWAMGVPGSTLILQVPAFCDSSCRESPAAFYMPGRSQRFTDPGELVSWQYRFDIATVGIAIRAPAVAAEPVRLSRVLLPEAKVNRDCNC